LAQQAVNEQELFPSSDTQRHTPIRGVSGDNLDNPDTAGDKDITVYHLLKKNLERNHSGGSGDTGSTKDTRTVEFFPGGSDVSEGSPDKKRGSQGSPGSLAGKSSDEKSPQTHDQQQQEIFSKELHVVDPSVFGNTEDLSKIITDPSLFIDEGMPMRIFTHNQSGYHADAGGGDRAGGGSAGGGSVNSTDEALTNLTAPNASTTTNAGAMLSQMPVRNVAMHPTGATQPGRVSENGAVLEIQESTWDLRGKYNSSGLGCSVGSKLSAGASTSSSKGASTSSSEGTGSSSSKGPGFRLSQSPEKTKQPRSAQIRPGSAFTSALKPSSSGKDTQFDDTRNSHEEDTTSHDSSSDKGFEGAFDKLHDDKGFHRGLSADSNNSELSSETHCDPFTELKAQRAEREAVRNSIKANQGNVRSIRNMNLKNPGTNAWEVEDDDDDPNSRLISEQQRRSSGGTGTGSGGTRTSPGSANNNSHNSPYNTDASRTTGQEVTYEGHQQGSFGQQPNGLVTSFPSPLCRLFGIVSLGVACFSAVSYAGSPVKFTSSSNSLFPTWRKVPFEDVVWNGESAVTIANSGQFDGVDDNGTVAGVVVANVNGHDLVMPNRSTQFMPKFLPNGSVISPDSPKNTDKTSQKTAETHQNPFPMAPNPILLDLISYEKNLDYYVWGGSAKFELGGGEALSDSLSDKHSQAVNSAESRSPPKPGASHPGIVIPSNVMKALSSFSDQLFPKCVVYGRSKSGKRISKNLPDLKNARRLAHPRDLVQITEHNLDSSRHDLGGKVGKEKSLGTTLSEAGLSAAVQKRVQHDKKLRAKAQDYEAVKDDVSFLRNTVQDFLKDSQVYVYSEVSDDPNRPYTSDNDPGFAAETDVDKLFGKAETYHVEPHTETPKKNLKAEIALQKAAHRKLYRIAGLKYSFFGDIGHEVATSGQDDDVLPPRTYGSIDHIPYFEETDYDVKMKRGYPIEHIPYAFSFLKEIELFEKAQISDWMSSRPILKQIESKEIKNRGLVHIVKLLHPEYLKRLTAPEFQPEGLSPRYDPEFNPPNLKMVYLQPADPKDMRLDQFKYPKLGYNEVLRLFETLPFYAAIWRDLEQDSFSLRFVHKTLSNGWGPDTDASEEPRLELNRICKHGALPGIAIGVENLEYLFSVTRNRSPRAFLGTASLRAGGAMVSPGGMRWMKKFQLEFELWRDQIKESIRILMLRYPFIPGEADPDVHFSPGREDPKLNQKEGDPDKRSSDGNMNDYEESGRKYNHQMHIDYVGVASDMSEKWFRAYERDAEKIFLEDPQQLGNLLHRLSRMLNTDRNNDVVEAIFEIVLASSMQRGGAGAGSSGGSSSGTSSRMTEDSSDMHDLTLLDKYKEILKRLLMDLDAIVNPTTCRKKLERSLDWLADYLEDFEPELMED